MGISNNVYEEFEDNKGGESVNRGETDVDNEISRGNNLLYHPLSYVLFVLLH
jgi:hypothetical protein